MTLLAAIGCGPSLRRVHRSDVYFERCYAADLDPRVPAAESRACWQAWMTHWQADQPPERVDYVRERLLRLDPERAAILALATGGADTDPAPLAGTASGAPAAEGETVEVAAAVEPAPTPVIESGADGAATPIDEPEPAPREIAPARERRARRTPLMPHVESVHCGEACRPVWVACTDRCADHDRTACLRACRLELRTCARACY